MYYEFHIEATHGLISVDCRELTRGILNEMRPAPHAGKCTWSRERDMQISSNLLHVFEPVLPC